MANWIFVSANDVNPGATGDDGKGKEYRELSMSEWMFRNMRNNFVVSGFLIPASAAGLTLSIPLGKAMIGGRLCEKDEAENVLFPANQTSYLWLRVELDGLGKADDLVFYQNTTGTDPDPDNTVFLGTVTTNATAVTSTKNKPKKRESAVSHARSGLKVLYQSATLLRVTGGTADISNRNKVVTKTATTDLDISSGGDFVSGSPGADQWVYVVINEDGDLKLTTEAPTISDEDENTGGKLQYRRIANELWRYLGARYSNASTQLDPFGVIDKLVYLDNQGSFVTNGTATTFTTVSASAGTVSPIAKAALISVNLRHDLDLAGTFFGGIRLRPTGSGMAQGLSLQDDIQTMSDDINSHAHQVDVQDSGAQITRTTTAPTTLLTEAQLRKGPLLFPVNTSQQIDYKKTGDTINVSVFILGYEDDLD